MRLPRFRSTRQEQELGDVDARRLTVLHIIGLVLIGGAAILSTWLVRTELSRQEIDSGVISAATRQATISSEIEAVGRSGGATMTDLDELNGLIDQLNQEFWALQATLGTDSFMGTNSSVQPVFTELVESTRLVADGMTGLAEFAELERRAGLFRSYMEITAAAFAEGAGERATRLKQVQIGLLQATLLLLAIEGFVLFRPAAKRLRAGLAAQEQRLAQDQEQLSYLAHFDSLTGLANRTMLHDRLAHAIERAQRSQELVAVIMVDLDKFSLINERFGQERGDKLLKLIAERVTSVVRSSDTIARSGGNEFTVVVEGIQDPRQASKIADKMLSAIAEPIGRDTSTIALTGTAGIALYPQDGATVDELLQSADLAMFTAKPAGGNTRRFFTQELRARTSKRLRLIDALRVAVEERTPFSVVYQPKVNIADEQVNGVEALIRWRDPQLGNISPAEFIPTAEETGLIVPLGEWVLEEACRQAKRWRSNGALELGVAVNIAARQFRSNDLVQTVRDVLSRVDLPPHLLELELTESTLVDDVVTARRTLHEIRDLGVKVSIDDFGTGYSSLSYLKGLPLDALKIDRSFIKDAIDEPDDAAIVNAIIQIAHSLRLKVIAEGVETEDQLKLVAAMGCDAFQGYLLSKPVDASEILGIVHSRPMASVKAS